MATLCWALLLLTGAPAASQMAQPRDFTPEQVSAGQALYDRNCSPCHGSSMADPEGAFDLRKFPHDQHERFVESIIHGKNTMPPWGSLLKNEEIEALWAYVVSGAPNAPAMAPAMAGVPTNAPSAQSGSTTIDARAQLLPEDQYAAMLGLFRSMSDVEGVALGILPAHHARQLGVFRRVRGSMQVDQIEFAGLPPQHLLD